MDYLPDTKVHHGIGALILGIVLITICSIIVHVGQKIKGCNTDQTDCNWIIETKLLRDLAIAGLVVGVVTTMYGIAGLTRKALAGGESHGYAGLSHYDL